MYRPGKPIDEVSRELGIEEIVKLASNEWPVAPFTEVQDALAAATRDLNRYPENSVYHLVNGLADHLEVPGENLWIGAGSTELIMCTAIAVGGQGTSVVFADPSFVMYPIAAALAGSEPIAVPSTERLGHDLDAMLAAIRTDTSLVFVCNPNNPTGTWLAAGEVIRFIDAVPDHALVVVDEAYFEFVTSEDYDTAVAQALARDNVVVARTFSKVFGLAGLRVGYMVGQTETLAQLRRAQVPFSVNSMAQVGAVASLEYPDRLVERVQGNATARTELEVGLADLGLDYIPSQTNFVLIRPEQDAAQLGEKLLLAGVIVRPMGPFLRVTVGTQRENRLLLEALATVLG